LLALRKHVAMQGETTWQKTNKNKTTQNSLQPTARNKAFNTIIHKDMNLLLT
jgi:hypothetical protein